MLLLVSAERLSRRRLTELRILGTRPLSNRKRVAPLLFR